MQAEPASTYSLLQGLLQPPSPKPSRLQRLLPSSGTLPQWNHPNLNGHRFLVPWLTGLRSLGQVIFINNPLSGAVLLMAFLVESPWLALLAGVGTAGANLSSRAFRLARGLRHQGIHGFNGALVGCAAAVLGGAKSLASPVPWLLLVLLGGGITTLILEGWGRRFQHRGSLPPLTLPFCLVSWGVLAMAGGLPLLPADPPVPGPEALAGPLQALALGLPRSFGQVFLCGGLSSGVLVLLATALASPLAAALGLLGALAAMGVALLQGVDRATVAQGLWGYNGVLVAIAIGGIFHAPTRRSLLLAVGGAALSTPISMLVRDALPGLPPLTLGFVITTWALILAARRSLPALMPVSLHAVVTPEEHRERYRVARDVLGTFRHNLRIRSGSGSDKAPLRPGVPELMRKRIQALFAQLDRDGDGSLNLAELRDALKSASPSNGAGLDQPSAETGPQLAAALAAMDLDGDGRVDLAEFTELIHRLQLLREGEERLLLYLMPADADGDDQLDADELQQLLLSIGQQPLSAAEQGLVFGPHASALTWRGFVDRLLLT
jgi:urea transporter/Ca2+-binding EF-hand superfamily protein